MKAFRVFEQMRDAALKRCTCRPCIVEYGVIGSDGATYLVPCGQIHHVVSGKYHAQLRPHGPSFNRRQRRERLQPQATSSEGDI